MTDNNKMLWKHVKKSGITKEGAELWLDYFCDGDCDECVMKMRVPGDTDRIDREPQYICECDYVINRRK